jgi:hypothetical protein
MTIRVPLISPIDAVVYRLDIQATWAVNPPGAEHSAGYDPVTEEPIIYRSAGVRVEPRQEMAAVRIPCQVETARADELNMIFGGNDPVAEHIFVFHRQDLASLSLIDANGNCLLKTGDRIGSLEKNGRTVKTYQKKLYIYRIDMGSQGFGPDGYDLEIAYTSYRSADPRGG